MEKTLEQQLREAEKQFKKTNADINTEVKKGSHAYSDALECALTDAMVVMDLYKKALRAEKRKVKELTTFSVSKKAVKLSKLEIGDFLKKIKRTK